MVAFLTAFGLLRIFLDDFVGEEQLFPEPLELLEGAQFCPEAGELLELPLGMGGVIPEVGGVALLL